MNIFILSKFCILGDLQLCSEYFFLKSENGRRFSVCFSISGLKIRLLTFLLWFERKKRTIFRKKSHNCCEEKYAAPLMTSFIPNNNPSRPHAGCFCRPPLAVSTLQLIHSILLIIRVSAHLKFKKVLLIKPNSIRFV